VHTLGRGGPVVQTLGRGGIHWVRVESTPTG
jgi:hypothetical protein